MGKLRSVIILFVLLFSIIPVWAAGQVFMPQLTDGSHLWSDFLTIDNTGSKSAEVKVTLYDIDGDQVYQGLHEVGSMGETLIDVRSLAGTAGSGRIEVPDGDSIHCRVSLVSISGGGAAEFLLDDAKSSNLAFLYSEFPGLTVWKGLVVTNYGDLPGDITFYAFGGGRLLAVSDSQDIAAHEKLLGVPSLWFPDIDPSKVKKIIAVSTIDSLGGVAIAGDGKLEKLLFTAAVPLQKFTVPEITMTGFWAGRWQNGADSGNVEMQITQNGDNLDGSVDLYGTPYGDIRRVHFTGTVTGNQVVLNASYKIGNYVVIFTSQGSFDVNSFTAVYQMDAAEASYHSEGTFTLTRQ